MVKRCAHGLCNSDSRYPERVANVKFIPFPKPYSDLLKCLRWIKLCNRPHEQLNVSRITKDTYVCSKHFINGLGPTLEFPDPVPALAASGHDGSLRATSIDKGVLKDNKRKMLSIDNPVLSDSLSESSTAVQTENNWIDPIDMLSVVSENIQLKLEINILKGKISQMQIEGSDLEVAHHNRRDGSTQTTDFL